MPWISRKKYFIDGKIATTLWSKYGSLAKAVEVYNAEYGFKCTVSSLERAVFNWMIHNPAEARELWNADCLKYNSPVPTDDEWDKIIRKRAGFIYRNRSGPYEKWEKWYTSS